jgi:hypothetical protein
MRRTMIQCLLLGIAGLAWVTTPEGMVPPLEWRLHFGIAEAAFGAMVGLGIGILMCRT